MRLANPTEQYEAMLYTVKGVHSVGFVDNRDQAQSWIMKEYEKIIGGESAVAIYDHKQNRQKIFVIDSWSLLPK
jgi:hypothetical protein